MIILLIALIFQGAITPWSGIEESPAHGTISYYNNGVMEIVAKNRGYISSTNDYQDFLRSIGAIGGAASMPCGSIGTYAYVYWEDSYELDGPYIVLDCSAEKDYDTNVGLGRVLEVDYQTATRVKMTRPIEATVIFLDKIIPLINFDKHIFI